MPGSLEPSDVTGSGGVGSSGEQPDAVPTVGSDTSNPYAPLGWNEGQLKRGEKIYRLAGCR